MDEYEVAMIQTITWYLLACAYDRIIHWKKGLSSHRPTFPNTIHLLYNDFGLLPSHRWAPASSQQTNGNTVVLPSTKTPCLQPVNKQS